MDSFNKIFKDLKVETYGIIEFSILKRNNKYKILTCKYGESNYKDLAKEVKKSKSKKWKEIFYGDEDDLKNILKKA